ncbi:GNAT family N-acetyltransferase [Tepidicaulis sp. LMO-SS28]|uniref:GNAT family N-acetyltransferase n=1 Tax=Tepidicaulis sp. LMO-SS28 TaxID=3447455 RepID=UPI003EE11D3C
MSISLWKRDGFEVSTDPSRLDKAFILRELAKTYWAAESSPENLWLSISNSRIYGLYGPDGAQIGFARAVTDLARFAWLGDVFICDAHKRRGLGKWLVEVIIGDPALATVARWMLATDDAHELYTRFGFERVSADDAPNLMVMRRPLS